MGMNVEMLRTGQIRPYEGNAKLHPDEQVAQIAASIKEFGFKQPLVVDRNNVLVIGHGRWLAAKRLKLAEVPAVRADDLTDEQVRALRLADNKTNEGSAWNYDVLDVEINEIGGIDLEQFGFEFDFTDPEQEHEKQAAIAQGRVSNILGLNKGSYAGTGLYDIPELAPVYELPEPVREWIPFNYVLSDKNPQGKGVHFFVDDYQFERLFKQPERYVDKLTQYVCVATPDFSPYSDMPMACQIYNHYRKHWVGAYLQSKGLTVIPTIRASRDERSLDWYLDGEPHGGIVLISSMWTADADAREYFKREYGMMYEYLNPRKVLVYGNEVEGLPGNIEYINTFTKTRWGK